MTIHDAVLKARSKNPELIPLRCTEFRNTFCFFMLNRNGEPVVNGSTYVVDKRTGKCGWKSLFEGNIFMEPPVKEYSEKDLRKIMN